MTQVVQATTTSWPWGQYETKMLRALSAAAKRFWSNYDPDDKDTAVNKAEIVRWLMEEHGCSENIAKAIDSILRADNAPGKMTKGLNPKK